ncbi:MAG: HAD family hydrolase [Calditrichia bacterium]
MARWAVFDVDGTLLPNTSMERLFTRELFRRGAIPPLNFARYLITAVLRTMVGRFSEGFKGNKTYLRGIPVRKIELYSEWLFENTIVKGLSQTGLKTLEEQRQAGYKIMLMSGSPDFLTNRLAERISADFVISAVLEKEGEVYSGRLIGLHPYGKRKKQLLLDTQARTQMDFDSSIVYANHHSDVHHMEMFEKAVAVNPTPALQKIAAERNWEIQVWD